MMVRPCTAVLLAGTLRPSPLREAMDMPALCLPMGGEGTVLDAWLRALATIDCLGDVRVVINSQSDVEALEKVVAAGRERGGIQTIAEPASWRGTAGILRDVTGDLPAEAMIVVGEANQLPPADLRPLLEPMRASVLGAVGVSGEDEPTGVYAFARRAFEAAPERGYQDLKEQLLPSLASRGERILPAALGEGGIRLRDRRAYLRAVWRSLLPHDMLRCSPRASVSGSAILDGFCVVESGSVVEDGAVVHDTVVLAGATIGGGAVISRSVIGPLATVPPRHRVVRQVVAATPATTMTGTSEPKRRTPNPV